MRRKSFLHEMRGVSPETKQRVIDYGGHPHNFLESSCASIQGLPNLDTDPQAQIIISGLNNAIKRLAEGETDTETVLGVTTTHDNESSHVPEKA